MIDETVRGELQHVQVGQVSFGYHQFGEGEPLVLFCGNAMCMSFWTDALLAALADEFSITIFDYHGMGQSTSPPETSWDIADMARLKFDLLAALGLDKPHVLGWSTGGEIVLQMAVIDGSRLGKVISVAGDPGAGYVGDPNVMDVISDASDEELLNMMYPADQREALNALIVDYLTRPQDEPTPEVLKRQTASWNNWLAGGIYDSLSQITNETLILNGVDDDLVNTQNAVNMAARIPGAWLVQVPDSGHAVLLQEPTFCSAIITQFLKGHTER